MANHQGACVACQGGTDSGLSFAGSEDWVASALVWMGVSLARALDLVDTCWLQPWRPMFIRACAPCAGDFRVGLVLSGRVPVTWQNNTQRQE
jgi:hypothetical protein